VVRECPDQQSGTANRSALIRQREKPGEWNELTHTYNHKLKSATTFEPTRWRHNAGIDPLLLPAKQANACYNTPE